MRDVSYVFKCYFDVCYLKIFTNYFIRIRFISSLIEKGTVHFSFLPFSRHVGRKYSCIHVERCVYIRSNFHFFVLFASEIFSEKKKKTLVAREVKIQRKPLSRY